MRYSGSCKVKLNMSAPTIRIEMQMAEPQAFTWGYEVSTILSCRST